MLKQLFEVLTNCLVDNATPNQALTVQNTPSIAMIPPYHVPAVPGDALATRLLYNSFRLYYLGLHSHQLHRLAWVDAYEALNHLWVHSLVKSFIEFRDDSYAVRRRILHQAYHPSAFELYSFLQSILTWLFLEHDSPITLRQLELFFVEPMRSYELGIELPIPAYSFDVIEHATATHFASSSVQISISYHRQQSTEGPCCGFNNNASAIDVRALDPAWCYKLTLEVMDGDRTECVDWLGHLAHQIRLLPGGPRLECEAVIAALPTDLESRLWHRRNSIFLYHENVGRILAGPKVLRRPDRGYIEQWTSRDRNKRTLSMSEFVAMMETTSGIKCLGIADVIMRSTLTSSRIHKLSRRGYDDTGVPNSILYVQQEEVSAARSHVTSRRVELVGWSCDAASGEISFTPPATS